MILKFMMDKCLIINKEKNRKIKESMNHKENQRNENIKKINLNSKKNWKVENNSWRVKRRRRKICKSQWNLYKQNIL